MFSPFRSRKPIAYAVAGLSILIASAARYLFDPVLEDHASFSFFFLAVSVAAWTGGIWPAAITAVISCLVGNYYFSHPFGTLQISGREELISLVIFLAVSLVIGWLSEISLRALARAKAAERAKDDFMATLAHELRSPLSAIHYANTLDRITGNEPARDHIDLIDRQVKHLDLMIQDLLDISRITRGKIRLDRKRIDAASIVAGAVEKARPLIDKCGHTLTVDVAPIDMPLDADPVRLEQVIANLLINAAKYTPDGGEISVRAEAADDSAVISVLDNGIGIAPEMLTRIFDLFVQTDRASQRSQGGLGIGLALVRKLVEMHGGSVSAKSAGLNQGSELIVTLPLGKPAPARAAMVGA